jgi:glycosyltransferase involved in cell wall biosynthesis
MAEPNSVLLVTKGLDIGGIERIVVDLAIGLNRRGIRTEVAVVSGARAQMLPLLNDVGIEVHDLGGSDRIGFGAARRLVSLASGGRFDVVHVHGPLPSIIARLRIGDSKLVTTSHTPWTSLRSGTRAMWRLTAWRDDAITAVSTAVADSLPGAGRKRCTVIPHGVDTERVARARTATKAQRGHAEQIAIVVASHRDAKNYPNLLHGFRIARDLGAQVRLVCIGDGPGLDAHRRLARELEIDHVVTFLPPRLDVLAEMAAADLLVVASDYEGQPMVVIEALALGLPIVATSVGNIPELVGAHDGSVVAPRDPTQLGRAIADQVQRGRGSSQGSHARSLDDVIDELLVVYEGPIASTS